MMTYLKVLSIWLVALTEVVEAANKMKKEG